MALCGLVGSMLVTLRDVVAYSRPRSEEGENSGARGGGGGGLGALPVPFTCCLLPLYNVDREVVRQKLSVVEQNL